MSFWGEVKRRDVFKVAVAYLVASWLIVQVVGVLTEPLRLPDALDTVVVVLLAIGFPFALLLAWVYEVTPDGIQVTAPDDDGRRRRRDPGQRLTYVVVVLCVMAVGLMAVERFAHEPASGGFGAGSRLAILPCTNLSPDPSNAFFAPGIHTELIRQLGSLNGLDVIFQNSVQQYADAGTPVPQIAEELQVDAVMACFAQYSGNRVLLTAQLVDGESDAHLWSDAYPADMSNLSEIFEIQANIAMNVANALRVEFLDEERERLERVATESREAYELFLAAYAIDLGSGVEGGERALALLEQSLMLDPLFVEAWALKGSVHNVIANFRTGSAVRAEYDQTIDAAQRILAIEPGSGLGNELLGWTLGQMGSWLEAEQEYRKALEGGVRREDMPARAVLQMAVGDFEGARDTLEANLRVDPMNSVAAGFSLITYAMTDDDDARRRAYERGERLYGNWFGDGMEFILRLGERDTEFVRTYNSNALDATTLKANLESPAMGLRALRELRRSTSSHSPLALTTMAQWAAYFGDSELSLQLLREAYGRGAVSNVWITWLPLFDEVRSEPGFKTLLEELDLPAYWRRFGWPEFCDPLEGEEFVCS